MAHWFRLVVDGRALCRCRGRGTANGACVTASLSEDVRGWLLPGLVTIVSVAGIGSVLTRPRGSMRPVVDFRLVLGQLGLLVSFPRSVQF
jgi:hypothetical protein